MYNDGECFEHNIQWRTSEIGEECPACKAEAERDTATQEAETRRENLETMIQRLLKTEAERDALKEAVDFYAKRYHDEHHQSDKYTNCQSEVCIAARNLKAGEK